MFGGAEGGFPFLHCPSLTMFVGKTSHEIGGLAALGFSISYFLLQAL